MIIDTILGIHNRILEKFTKNEPDKAQANFKLTNFLIIEILIYRELFARFKLCESNKIDKIIYTLLELSQINDIEAEILLNHYENNKACFNQVEAFLQQNEEIDVVRIYEWMLTLDIGVCNQCFCTNISSQSRDRSGAYYTSHEFAKLVTRKAVDSYLEKAVSDRIKPLKEIIENTKIIDMSCGTGMFLVAVTNIFKEMDIQNLNIKKVLSNIYGIDVDLIALKIVTLNMVIVGEDVALFKTLKDNFVLGNTLINSKNANYKEKLEAYLQGRIYSLLMGINQDQFVNQYDIVLGNPPWEKIRFEDKNFFASYDPTILSMNKKNDRQKAIDELSRTNPELEVYANQFIKGMNECKEQIKNSQYYIHSARGELNTYALFTELGILFAKKEGEVGLIVKSALITSKANSGLFGYLVDNNYVRGIYDFVNLKKIFPIDSRERFAVIYLCRKNTSEFSLAMNLIDPQEMNSSKKHFSIDKNVLTIMNPETRMIPNVDSEDTLKILLDFHNKFRTFNEEYPDAKFGRIVHFTNHADSIIKKLEDGYIPIYEGKFIEGYDGKFSTFADMSDDEKYKSKATARLMTEEEKKNRYCIPQSRYFIKRDKWESLSKNYVQQYSIFWRSLTSATNRRITLATILPHIPTSQSIQLLQYNDDKVLVIILALFNSVIFDYLVKLKLNGIDLTQTIIKQIPVPAINIFKRRILFLGYEDCLENHIIERVMKLYENDARLDTLRDKFNNTMELSADYKKIKIEIDFLVSRAYEINTSQLVDIMECFPRYYEAGDIEYIKELDRK